MCLILFSWQENPDCPLIIAANRDEFFERQTESLHRWADLPILAGRDIRAGGTWMGISSENPHRVAAVTNVRDGEPKVMPDKRSRGNLPVEYLLGTDSPEAAARRLVDDADDYAPVNLIVADERELWWATNWPEPTAMRVEPGVHGLSNGGIDNDWPKVVDGRAALTEVLGESGQPDTGALLAMLDDRHTVDENRLPDTGIGRDREIALSARFIDTQEYGTRAATVLRVDRDGRGEATERRYDHGTETGTTTIIW